MPQGKKKRTRESSYEEKKCAKHEAKLASKRGVEAEEEKKVENLSISGDDIREISEETELPFDDILADQRRKYSWKDEYIYLMYNDLVKNFVEKWDGTYIRKSIVAKDSFDQKPEGEEEDDESDELSVNADESTDFHVKFDVSWKLMAPDEEAKIIFINGNSYEGRISRKKMEGQGVYRWRNGSQYTGHFEDNKIHGKGHVEWPNGAWYEGDFENGYQHGKGTMVNKNYDFLYIGQWEHGRKHGKGYCTYGNGCSYEGDWIMDKRDGVGNCIHSDGSRYVGKWKEGFRHGTGTMTWPNGDVYRGEWKNGAMHGYGEYTWNGFLNNTLSWPQEVCYMGEWQEGTRTGRGQITLNSIGGARYSGEWRKNKKHGKGTIIGNNGEITEVIFENDILLPPGKPKTEAGKNEKETRNAGENDGKKIRSGIHESNERKSSEKIENFLEARTTTIAEPEQHISLDYYIDRLRPKKSTQSSLSLVSLASVRSEDKKKCEVCENESCRCLSKTEVKSSDAKRMSIVSSKVLNSNLSPSSKNPLVISRTKHQNIPGETSDSKILESEMNLEKEKYWTHNCITMHMPRIRKIYDDYSKMFANVRPKCRLSMSRLALWQLWRDCGIHKKNISLVKIDNYLAANESTLMGNSSCPFERIEIWQLIHAFLEVSWHFYTKNREYDSSGYFGKLASGLNTFLINDIYRNVGKCTGVLCGPERDLIPLYPVYELYESIGLSHSARQLLNAVFPVRGSRDLKVSSESKPSETSMPEFQMEGRNSVTVGEKLSFFINDETPLIQPKPRLISFDVNDRSNNSLHVFRELGSKIFTELMSGVCPSIKDSETGAIVNIEYELTFLEFLEIFVEAGKRLVLQRKMSKESDCENHEIEEKLSIAKIAKDEEAKASNIRISSENKTIKTKKRLSSRR